MTDDSGGARGERYPSALAQPRAALALLVTVLAVLCSCRQRALSDTVGFAFQVHTVAAGQCAPGHPGCPCDVSSGPVACGEVARRSGNYLTCSMGQSFCLGGQWSACLGGHLVTKSAGGATVGAGGLRLLSVNAPCHDNCDPNCAALTEFDGGDVDGAGGVVSSATGATVQSPGCVGLQCQPPPTGCQTPEWFEVDMLAPQAFFSITLDSADSPDDYPRAFQVLVSNDGMNWGSPVAMGLGTSAVITVNFPPQTARYIRVVQAGSTVGVGRGWWWSIHEFNVYGGTLASPTALSRTGWGAAASESENAGVYPATASALRAIDGDPGTRFSTGTVQTPPSTTLIGVVRDPAGSSPVYNALVYVPALSALPPIPSGASCDSCPDPAGLKAAVVGQTGPDGVFVLTNVPTTDLAPMTPIPLVVQAGKWRREVTLASVPSCVVTAVDTDHSRLPRTSGEGNIPKIAIATGQHDPLECLLLKMGVAPTEFELPGAGSGRIDYYVANGVDFSTPAPPESSLVGAPATLSSYDAVLLPCEGSEDDGANIYAGNVAAYANAGGRVLTTHFSYTWLATPTMGTANAVNPATGGANPFYDVAAPWDLSDMTPPSSVAAIDTTLGANQYFPTGQALSFWLTNVGASAMPAQLPVSPAFHDLNGVNAPAVRWAHDNAMPNETLLMSFNTPFVKGGASGTCGRVIHSELHMSAADKVAPTAMGSCATNADCGFTATCSVADAGATGVCSASATTFPLSCLQAPLTPQQDALEFALLGLTECVAPASVVPTVPPETSGYVSATFSEDIASNCPFGSHVVWRELDWYASVPPSASIVFSVQTADRTLDGGPPDWTKAKPVVLVTDTTSIAPPQPPGSPDQFEPVIIDAPASGDAGAGGALNLANPPQTSGGMLRLTVTLNPTSDGSASPTLNDWQVKYDCAASE